jgi:hypothetical protein
LAVTAQFFVSSEILASTLVMTAICLVAVMVIGRRSIASHLHAALIGAAWAAGVSLVLLAYPVWFALRGPGHIDGPIQLVPEAYRADLLGPIVPNLYTWLAPSGLVRVSENFANSTVENGSYLGITLLVTLAIGSIALWRRSPVARVAVVGGIAAFVLSLGGGLVVHHRPGAAISGIPLPERVFAHLPLLSNTIPVRYSMEVALFASLLLAIVLDNVHAALVARRPHGSERSAASRGVRIAVPALVAIVCLVPLVPNLPLGSIVDVATPAYFTSVALDAQPAGAVTVLFPYPSAAQPAGQIWQAVANMHFRSPGGYFLVPDGPQHLIGFSADVSYGADTLTARTLVALAAGSPPAETPALRAGLLAQFHRWHVTSVIASPSGVVDPAGAIRFLTWLVGRPPVRTVDVDAWYQLPA